MFPKYLTPGKKNFLNKLVLTDMEENFQNEDRQHTVLTPVKLSCTFPRRQVASACSGRQDHWVFTVSVARLSVKRRNGTVPQNRGFARWSYGSIYVDVKVDSESHVE